MKVSTTTIFCVLTLVKSWTTSPIINREELFASALISIIQKFYVEESNNIFVTSNRDDATHNLILQHLFSALERNISITWILHDQDYLDGNIDRFSNIILIDSYKSFRSIFTSITTTSFESFGFYTIVETSSIAQTHETDRYNIFRDLWQNNIVNVNILTHSNTTIPSILLYTYFPFAPNYCGKIAPVCWNSFANGHFEQPNKQIFPSKTENLFQCPISILASPIPPYIFITGNNSDGSYDFDGTEYHLLHELSKRINFKPNISIYWEPYLGEFYGFNGSAGGAFGMILERKHDVLVEALIYEPYLKKILSSTIGYLHDNLVLAVPNPRLYSSFETLFFPFTPTVWIALTTTLLVAVIMIIILKRNRKKYYDIVARTEDISTYLNLFRVLLTASAFYKPKASIARTLLMVWILASFVLQNVYQGQLFYFIKSHKMVASVKNIDELVEEGITVKLVEDNFATFLIFDQRLQKLLRPVDPISDWEYVTETESYITFEIQLKYETKRTRDEVLVPATPKTIKIASYSHIFDLSKRFYLNNSMDEKIGYMNEYGLTSKWGATYRDTSMTDDKDNPRQLNISQILGVVQVWFGLLILATVLFILEMICCIITNTRQILQSI